MRENPELRVTEAAGLEFAAGEDKRSRLPSTVDLLLRLPALTVPALARRLDITPQAALRLFARLEQAGLVREVTARTVFGRSPLLCGQMFNARRDANPGLSVGLRDTTPSDGNHDYAQTPGCRIAS